MERDIYLPKEIGPYKIDGIFNKGGMSILYLGHDQKSARPLVIKVLLPNFIKNKEVAENFLKEAEIISLTNHPNIIKLYDQGVWEKGLYIATEFIQGISLKQFILQKSLSLKKALEIILQVAYALCHLHSHKVIHRDLKPENILITETGEIKVIDFGIAQLKNENEKNIQTQAKIIGTLVYMSPEQKKSPNQVTFASDIYSLGIIAYELILGKLSHGQIELDLIPEGLRNILKKTLAQDLQERYLDVVEFITDISQYLTHNVQEKKSAELTKQFFSLKDKTAFLMPQNLALSAYLDFHYVTYKKAEIDDLYIDLLNINDDRSLIILAKPNPSDISVYPFSFLLKGMIQMLVKQPNFSLENFLKSLNSALIESGMHHPFDISAILILPDKDQLTVSVNANHYFALVKESSSRLLDVNLFSLSFGQNIKNSFIETSFNWKINDRFFLLGKNIKEKEKEKILSSKDKFPLGLHINNLFNLINLDNKNRQDAIPCLISADRKK